MGSIGPAEILVVLVVALLVLGPNRLPDAARSVGRAIGEVRRYTSGFQDEMREAFAEPQPKPTYPASSDATPTEWRIPLDDGSSPGTETAGTEAAGTEAAGTEAAFVETSTTATSGTEGPELETLARPRDDDDGPGS